MLREAQEFVFTDDNCGAYTAQLRNSRNALEDANTILSAIISGEPAREADAKTARDHLNVAEMNLDNAICEVIKNSPRAARALHDYQIARQTFLGTARLMLLLGEAAALPDRAQGWAASPIWHEPLLKEPMPEWQAAFVRLRDDPNTPLPD